MEINVDKGLLRLLTKNYDQIYVTFNCKNESQDSGETLLESQKLNLM